jgi:SHS2 domain-containing protein
MADPKTVAVSWQQRIVKTEALLDELLIEWLSEIVYWKDAAAVVFRNAPLTLMCSGDRWTLDAVLLGAPVDHAAQTLRNDVKGITRHLYRLEQVGPVWKARVVVDV